jgi:hypothetical protein
MRCSHVPTICVALTLAVAAGCQSAPTWAWWKRDKPVESSAVARTAAPDLPSSKATPQVVAGTGISPATPPSSANLAATAPATGAAGSSAAALAPTGGPATAGAIYPTTSAPPLANQIAVPSATSAQALAAQAGPYDPNGYRPTMPATPPSVAATPDSRYVASTSAAPAATLAAPAGTVLSETPISAAATSATPASPDRYGITPYPVTSGAAAGPVPQASTEVASLPQTLPADNRYGNVPAVVNELNPSPASAIPASVQLSAAPGQYRPGGTSNYTGGAFADHVEIATRPATPNTSTPSSTTPAYPSTTHPSTDSGAVRPY